MCVCADGLCVCVLTACVCADGLYVLIAAFLLTVSTILFGVKVDQDREWLPHPDSTFLSWAYGFAILADFLCLFSGMLTLTDFFRVRLEDKYDERAQGGARYSAPPLRHAAPPSRYGHASNPRY